MYTPIGLHNNLQMTGALQQIQRYPKKKHRKKGIPAFHPDPHRETVRSAGYFPTCRYRNELIHPKIPFDLRSGNTPSATDFTSSTE